MSTDVLDRLTSYRPTDQTLAAEFDPVARARIRGALFDDARSHTVRFRPVRRSVRWMAPLTASVTVLAVVAGLAALRSPGGSPAALSGGDATHFAGPGLSTAPDIGRHKYVEKSVRSFDVGRDGRPVAAHENRSTDFVSPNGDDVSFRSGDQNLCYDFVHSGPADFSTATQEFVAALPTDPQQLRTYLLAHVSGSSSKDEAVFVAVGDLLRLYDGLASPRLRAALVDVLSRSHLITVHAHDVDYLGRPAVRADFTDQRRRPGELDSLYFDPATFRLLEERSGSSGQPGPQPGAPSFAYSATPPASAGTPAELTGAASVSVVTAERPVDHLPASARTCLRQS